MSFQYPYVNMQQQQQWARPFIQQEQPIHGFIFVHGLEGAYAYHLPNGSEMPLFDDDETKNLMYIKKVDFDGRATVEVRDVLPHVEQTVEYVTRDDLNALYAEIDNLRSALTQPVSAPAHARQE